jgi:putative transposase
MSEPVVHHVWFATKRRKWLLQGDVDSTVKKLIHDVAREKNIEVMECETAIDHVHLLLRLREGQSLPKIMNLLKGVSSRRLHQTFPELKLDSHSHHFWQRGYDQTIVAPASLAARRRYVRTQKDRLQKFEGR